MRGPRWSQVRVVMTAIASWACVIAMACVVCGDEWQDRRRELDDESRRQFATLAAKCDELGMKPQGDLCRGWLLDRDRSKQYFSVAAASESPRAGGGAAGGGGESPALVEQWRNRFLKLRADRAERLFALAREAAEGGRGDLAFRWLHDVLREQPEHVEANRILDDSNARGPGRGRGRQAKSYSPKVDHAPLSWKRGQYWQVDTRHFRILTNHSQQAGRDLGQRLEELLCVWQQLCFPVWSTNEALQARFAGRDEPLGARRVFNVVLVKSRDEYVEKLRAAESRIELTTGIYLDRQQTAYFYAGDETTRPTWFHEAAHQLFQEMLDAPPKIAATANIWAVEAAALYFESLNRGGGGPDETPWCSLGGLDAPRLQLARYYVRRGAFYMPLSELVALGREQLQSHEQIRPIYTESAGLAHFLFDGDEGRWRAGWLKYLKAIYLGRDRADTLTLSTGVELAELDQRFHSFLDVTDAELERLALNLDARQLSLVRTAVSDAGLKAFAPTTKLELLDLAFTRTSGAALASFRQNKKLRQLYLEGVGITDEQASELKNWPTLEELDLSGTPVGDAGLAHVAGLKNLRQLYLIACPVTDRGLLLLKDCKQLEQLDVTDSQVTPAGMAALRKALPKVKITPAP